MSKPETSFYTSVHRYLPPVESLHREKMNNPYSGGTADCWYSGPKADLWIEYKFMVLPKRDSTMIDLCGGRNPPLSALQQEWLRRRSEEGRSVWVIVGTPEGGVLHQSRAWETPTSAGNYRAWLESRRDLAQAIIDFTGYR